MNRHASDSWIYSDCRAVVNHARLYASRHQNEYAPYSDSLTYAEAALKTYFSRYPHGLDPCCPDAQYHRGAHAALTFGLHQLTYQPILLS